MSTFRPLNETKFINDANLVSYWPLNESSGNATDIKSGNNLTNVGTIAYGAAKFGNGSTHTGSSATGLELNPVPVNLKLISAYTFVCWINYTTTTAQAQVVGSNWYTDPNPYTSGIMMYITSDKMNIMNGASTSTPYIYKQAAGSTTLNDGIWHCCIGTWDGTNIKMYVDGKLETGAITGTGTNPAYSGNEKFEIGRRWLYTGYDTPFTGKVDDVAIFSRALSASEVNELYQGMTYGEYLGAGSATTKLLLHLNGNSTDSSGNENNGTDTAITYVDGKFGKCASFNGSSSWIKIASKFLSLAASSSMTCSLWFNVNATVNGSYAIDITGSENNRSISIDFPTGYVSAYLYANTTQRVSSNFAINNNGTTWYNVIVTKNSSDLLSMYVNGKFISSVTVSGTQDLGGTTNGIGIGKHSNTAVNSGWVTGLIDEVIIENIAWTTQEVAKYYSYASGRYATL